MTSNKQTVFVGERYQSLKGGWFTIIYYTDSRHIEVLFDSGYRTWTTGAQIRSGKIKNKLYPCVCGVGFIGEGPFGVYEGKDKSKAYRVWNSMLARCYDPNSAEYFRYGAKGVTVHPYWYNFQHFALWYTTHYFEGAEVDKDLSNSSVYSPTTCVLLSRKDNTVLAHAVECQFVSPEGVLTDVYNIAEFARSHGLDASALSKVRKGTRNHCGGWTLPA